MEIVFIQPSTYQTLIGGLVGVRLWARFCERNKYQDWLRTGYRVARGRSRGGKEMPSPVSLTMFSLLTQETKLVIYIRSINYLKHPWNYDTVIHCFYWKLVNNVAWNTYVAKRSRVKLGLRFTSLLIWPFKIVARLCHCYTRGHSINKFHVVRSGTYMKATQCQSLGWAPQAHCFFNSSDSLLDNDYVHFSDDEWSSAAPTINFLLGNSHPLR